jgi:hypothetical protein
MPLAATQEKRPARRFSPLAAQRELDVISPRNAARFSAAALSRWFVLNVWQTAHRSGAETGHHPPQERRVQRHASLGRSFGPVGITLPAGPIFVGAV